MSTGPVKRKWDEPAEGAPAAGDTESSPAAKVVKTEDEGKDALDAAGKSHVAQHSSDFAESRLSRCSRLHKQLGWSSASWATREGAIRLQGG